MFFTAKRYARSVVCISASEFDSGCVCSRVYIRKDEIALFSSLLHVMHVFLVFSSMILRTRERCPRSIDCLSYQPETIRLSRPILSSPTGLHILCMVGWKAFSKIEPDSLLQFATHPRPHAQICSQHSTVRRLTFNVKVAFAFRSVYFL